MPAILKDNPAAMNPEEIKACLSCEKIVCNDCFSRAYRGGKRRKYIDAKALTAMYNSGVTVKVMAQRLGVNEETLSARLKLFGIPTERPRLYLRKEHFEALDFDTRLHITWGGESLT